jgi:hypothetical protein
MADEFFDRFAELAGGKVEDIAPQAPAAKPTGAAAFEPASWIPHASNGTGILLMVILLLS